MLKKIALTGLLGCVAPLCSMASVISITVSGLTIDSEGTFGSSIHNGSTVTATFTYTTDTNQAGPGSQPNPSNEPGHEFSSFWEFEQAFYGVSVSSSSGFSFNSNLMAVIINDNIYIEDEGLEDFIPAGTYDWLELMGSTTLSGPNDDPISGIEWTLAFFTDTGWITDGSLIPDGIPSSYTPILLGIEYDANGDEIGFALIDVSSVNVSVVPEPSTVAGIFGLVALGCAYIRRRRS